MIPLSRTLRQARGGRPLPTVFPSLERAGVRPRLGQVTLIVGQPNAGKTLFALNYAMALNLPTLYLSADTDQFTLGTRAGALASGRTIADVEENYRTLVMDQNEGIEFSFDSLADQNSIRLEIVAYAEKYGQWPKLIIIDNLLNIGEASSGDWSEMMRAMHTFHVMARTMGAAVFVLHHTNESVPGNPCPPRFAITNKVSQLPELILSLAQSGDERMAACAVKNRNGRSYPAGNRPTWLYLNFNTLAVNEDSVAWAARRGKKEWT
jgi:hypothetical protein